MHLYIYLELMYIFLLMDQMTDLFLHNLLLMMINNYLLIKIYLTHLKQTLYHFHQFHLFQLDCDLYRSFLELKVLMYQALMKQRYLLILLLILLLLHSSYMMNMNHLMLLFLFLLLKLVMLILVIHLFQLLLYLLPLCMYFLLDFQRLLL